MRGTYPLTVGIARQDQIPHFHNESDKKKLDQKRIELQFYNVVNL